MPPKEPTKPTKPIKPPQVRPGPRHTGPVPPDPVTSEVVGRLRKKATLKGKLLNLLRALAWRAGFVAGRTADGQGVRIAIFDSWPMDDSASYTPCQPAVNALDKIRRQASTVPAASRGWRIKNACSGELVAADAICDWVSPSASHGTQCSPGLLDPRGKPTTLYETEPHGLFVTDLIDDIAPEADFEVHRVLDKWGIGDLSTIVQAVECAIANAGDRKLILNFSLGVAPPLVMVAAVLNHPTCYYTAFAQYAQDLGAALAATAPGTGMSVPDYLRDPTRALLGAGNVFTGALGAIQFLLALRNEPNILAVAATGNDSTNANALTPRIPAALDGVLAVSGFVEPPRSSPSQPKRTASWARSDFSNDDDFFTNKDGVGAYAGADRGLDTDDDWRSPVAIFLDARVPIDPANPNTPVNESGYASWAGTSFAAPVAAGFAACLWGMKPSLTPVELFAKVTGEPSAPKEYLPFRQV